MLDVTIYLKELDKALQVSVENDARERAIRRVENKAGRMMPGLRSAIEAWAAARSDVCIRGETANGLHLSMHCDRSYAELEPALPRGWKSIVTRDSRKKKELWQAMDQMRP